MGMMVGKTTRPAGGRALGGFAYRQRLGFPQNRPVIGIAHDLLTLAL
jgi:hypothetical protein